MKDRMYQCATSWVLVAHVPAQQESRIAVALGGRCFTPAWLALPCDTLRVRKGSACHQVSDVFPVVDLIPVLVADHMGSMSVFNVTAIMVVFGFCVGAKLVPMALAPNTHKKECRLRHSRAKKRICTLRLLYRFYV